jgi:hypothetical protein
LGCNFAGKFAHNDKKVYKKYLSFPKEWKRSKPTELYLLEDIMSLLIVPQKINLNTSSGETSSDSSTNASNKSIRQIGSKQQNQFLDCIEAAILNKFSQSKIFHQLAEEITEAKSKMLKDDFMHRDFEPLAEADAFLEKESGKGRIIHGKIEVQALPFIYTILNQKRMDMPKAFSPKEIDQIATDILKCTDADLLRACESYSSVFQKQSEYLTECKIEYLNQCFKQLAKNAQPNTVKAIDSKIDKTCIKICSIVHVLKSHLLQLQLLSREEPNPILSPRKMDINEIEKELKNIRETITGKKEEIIITSPTPKKKRSQSVEVRPIPKENKEGNRKLSLSVDFYAFKPKKLFVDEIVENYPIFKVEPHNKKEAKAMIIDRYKTEMNSLKEAVSDLVGSLSNCNQKATKLEEFFSHGKRSEYAYIFGGELNKIHREKKAHPDAPPPSQKMSTSNRDLLNVSPLINEIFDAFGENTELLQSDAFDDSNDGEVSS